MVDQDPEYRARRAAAAGGAEPTATPRPPDAPDAPGEDEPRPIFREEADGVDAATVRTPAAPGRTGRRPTFVKRAPRLDDEDEDESTTLLPRTTSGRRGATAVDPDDEDGPRRRLAGRTRLALLAGVVAAVVVVGIAIIYAVSGVSGTPGTSGDPSVSTGPGGASASPTSTELLGEAALLSAEGADPIDARRTWSVQGTVTGDTSDAPAVACLGSDPLEGAPSPEQKVLRTLTSDGKTPPGVLHVASAYRTADEANQAFEVTARALGTCAVTGDYLFSGRVVTGAGDVATGSLVLSGGANPTGHSVLVSRTGRVLDVVDAYQPKSPPNVNNVAKALASVVAAQCPSSGGGCADAVKVSDGPPPAGGDQPGFLSTGDLPPVGGNPAPWVATPVEPPAEDFSGSQCETVNWSTVAATDKTSRIYLLQDTPGFFGLNDIVVTTKDEAAAKKLVDKVRKDWTTCKERKLTATVPAPTKVTGVAAEGAPVVGYTAEVRQKAGDATTRYRVGIASSGTKVAFTFLNPVKGLDLTADQWNLVAVRAVQRATQTG